MSEIIQWSAGRVLMCSARRISCNRLCLCALQLDQVNERYEHVFVLEAVYSKCCMCYCKFV